MTRKLFALFAFLLMSVSLGVSASRAAEEEKPLKIEYRFTPPAPREQGEAEVAAQSAGCYRSEEHTSELQSLMRISYAVFCLTRKQQPTTLSIDPSHVL